jgi:hypothetical protein
MSTQTDLEIAKYYYDHSQASRYLFDAIIALERVQKHDTSYNYTSLIDCLKKQLERNRYVGD